MEKRKSSIQTSKTRGIGVRIPNKDFDRLEKYRSAHELSISEVVCAALSKYLDEEEERESMLEGEGGIYMF